MGHGRLGFRLLGCRCCGRHKPWVDKASIDRGSQAPRHRLRLRATHPHESERCSSHPTHPNYIHPHAHTHNDALQQYKQQLLIHTKEPWYVRQSTERRLVNTDRGRSRLAHAKPPPLSTGARPPTDPSHLYRSLPSTNQSTTAVREGPQEQAVLQAVPSQVPPPPWCVPRV